MKFWDLNNKEQFKEHVLLIDILNDAINTSNNDEDIFNNYYRDFEFFYNNRHVFLNCINDKRVINIYKFFLKNNKERVFIYAEAELVEQLQRTFSNYFLDFFSNEKNIDDNVINEMKIIKKYYDELYNVINSNEFINNLNEDFNKSSVKQFSNIKINRDYENAIILILSTNLMNMSVDNIKSLLEIIKNGESKEYLNSLLTDNKKLSLLDKEFIIQYINKFVLLEELISSKEIEGDTVLNQIFMGDNNNIELFNYSLKKISIDNLLDVYKWDINNFIDSLDKYNLSDSDKLKYVYYFFDKMFNEELTQITLFKYYIQNKGNVFCDMFFKDDIVKELTRIVSMSLIENLDEEIILYLLSIDDYLEKEYLIVNLIEYERNVGGLSQNILNIIYQNKNIVNQVNEFELLDMNTLQKYIFDVISGKEIDNLSLCLLFKNFTKIFNNNETPVYLTYFFKDRVNGAYYDDINSIGLNINRIMNIKKYKYNNNPYYLDILKTIFHESTHFRQFKKMNDEEREYFSSDHLIEKYFPKFYETNYKNISYEFDARIVSYDMCIDFFKNFDKDKSITNYYNRLKESELIKDKRTIIGSNKEESISDIFKLLISLKPEIKEKQFIVSHIKNVVHK